MKRHPGTPREGDVPLHPAEFPFLLHLLSETRRREQPVHSACCKEMDLGVTHRTELLQPRLQHRECLQVHLMAQRNLGAERF